MAAPVLTEHAIASAAESRPTTRDAGDQRLVRAEVSPKAMPTLRPSRRPSCDHRLPPHPDGAFRQASRTKAHPRECGRPFRHPLQPDRTRWPVWRASLRESKWLSLDPLVTSKLRAWVALRGKNPGPLFLQLGKGVVGCWPAAAFPAMASTRSWRLWWRSWEGSSARAHEKDPVRGWRRFTLCNDIPMR